MELKKTLNMPKGKFEMRANLVVKEPKLVEYYKKINLYEKMLKKNEGKKSFYLHDGPAYANGDIHAGHALNRILKDIIVRFHTLNGEYTPYQPGWDTHGLPIETQVTKSGVDRKKISVAEFRQKCHDYALTQVDRQRNQTVRLGCLGNFDDPYLTLDKHYEANQLRIFAKMLEDGLIYKGLKPVNWSPSSESALAEAEIEYRDVPAKTIFVKFPVIKGKGEVTNDYNFVIWTTTPWTLPANLAICVNPKFTYGLYKTDQGKLIFLAELLDKLTEQLGLTNVKLQTLVSGKDLENIICSHPFLEDRTSLVILGDHVTNDAGTGCVHTAPGHGMDDYLVGLKYHLEPFCPVDNRGYMTKDAGKRLEGMFYEEANDEVITMLKETGCLLKEEDIVHAYPHDWRTKKPLIFRATPQWFLNQKALKEKLVKNAEEVSYLPSWGKVRLVNMLSGRDEWCLSRQRAWGVPIPIIYKDGEPLVDKAVLDHIIDLVDKNGSNIWYQLEPKDLLPEGYYNPNSVYTKETDIMDVWFDSGSSFLGSDIARNLPFPADIYLEGNDQYRGWYNSSIILSTAYTGQAPFKKIVTHGFIVDQNGEKFSKSKGNGISPNDVVKEYGADILRLWTTTIDYNTAEIKFSRDLLKVCSDGYRKIRNVFKFMLANLNDNDEVAFDVSTFDTAKLSYIDTLVLNRFKKMLADIKAKYLDCDFLSIQSMITNFVVNDLSSFYLDFNKENLYCNKIDSDERRSCQYVLHTIVKNLAIALSPILPFTMDEVYYYLNMKDKKESIALEDYPDLGDADDALLKEYNLVLSFKDHANKIIETARNNQVVKGNAEVELHILLSEEEKRLLDNLPDYELARLLNISKLVLDNEEKVVKLETNRCDRCWNYFDHLEEIDSETHVCHRCHEAIKETLNEEN